MIAHVLTAILDAGPGAIAGWAAASLLVEWREGEL